MPQREVDGVRERAIFHDQKHPDPLRFPGGRYSPASLHLSGF
jgi:hypothetical protein